MSKFSRKSINMPETKITPIRLPPELKKAALKRAEQEHQNLTQYIIELIKRDVKRKEKKTMSLQQQLNQNALDLLAKTSA